MDHRATSSLSSSSQALLRLIQHLLPPSSPDSLISSHFASALQLLSNSASSSSSTSSKAASSEFTVAEKIKKRLIRDGRDSDIVSFQSLHHRLQRSTILKHRESLLTLLLLLSDAPPQQQQQNRLPKQQSQQKFNKVAPFMVHQGVVASSTPMQQGSAENGQDSLPSYLSSIHTIRHQISSVGGSYHPPIPPKPNLSHLQQQPKSSSPSSCKPNEKALIRELIYAFQGIEGTMIRRGGAGGFHVAEAHRDQFSPSAVQVCLRLAELGWLYSRVRSFCDEMSEKKEFGLVAQSLVAALRNEMAEYYQLLATLESSDLSLLQLSVWTMEPTNRMKLLVTIVDSCRGQRGGELVSQVYSFLGHGDEASSQTVRAILCTVCQPLYLMLLRWICDGTLEDPYSEFFIASDARVHGDRLWHEKYSIRESMIPNFVGRAWASKVLATGKSINFLHEVCHDSSPISGRDVIKASLDETSPENLFSHPNGDNLLHQTIQRAFTDTSAHVLSILFTRYKFLDHISAMRKYLLLGQGDIIRYLLQLLETELCQPATTLYPHNLAGILETAIRATNAQYEDPDILERLDIKLLAIQDGDTGWDVFSLDYKVGGPIGTVFGPETMNQYLMLFNALWRAKRIEWMLSGVWKRQAELHKMCKTVPELKPLLHIANLLASEMIHFIHQLAYYITFEVMECSWDILLKRLRRAESLDEVIEAHEEFLQTLVRQSLLDDDSQQLLVQLRAIYDRIIEFQGVQSKLYTSAVGEVEARAADVATLKRRERQGVYGVTDVEEESQRERTRTFGKIILQNLKSQLKICSQSYQDKVRSFLLELANSQDQALQCLSFRLDFNQHYKRNDTRLGATLTVQGRRESMLSSSFRA